MGEPWIRIWIDDGRGRNRGCEISLPLSTLAMAIVNDTSLEGHPAEADGFKVLRVKDAWANGDGAEFLFRRIPSETEQAVILRAVVGYARARHPHPLPEDTWPDELRLETDGNISLWRIGQPVFKTGTDDYPARPDSKLVLTKDGDVQIHGPDGAVIWTVPKTSSRRLTRLEEAAKAFAICKQAFETRQEAWQSREPSAWLAWQRQRGPWDPECEAAARLMGQAEATLLAVAAATEVK